MRRETDAFEVVRSSIDGKLVLIGSHHGVWIWDPGVRVMVPRSTTASGWPRRDAAASLSRGRAAGARPRS